MWAVVWVVGKGLTVAVVALSVVQSDLTPFVQALIIATVAAMIGAFGLIIQAMVNARSNERIAKNQEKLLERQEQLAKHMKDVKATVGADKRRTDP